MHKISALALAAVAVVAVSGCAAARSPVTGGIYTQVKANDSVTSNELGSKMGKSEATSILGWIGMGDCSIATAAAAGQIKTVTHVDYETMSILGFYAKTTTIVYGK